MGKGKGGVGGFLSSGGAGGALYRHMSGANDATKAAQNAAMAQQQAAAQTRQQVLDYGSKFQTDMMDLAKATPQELNALSQSFSAAEQNLSREQRLLDAIDPALMEASKQALALMRGESAGITKPMNDMRAMQRRQLVDSLRSQYGPGAESTSIGQRALQQFDMQSSSMFADQQQGALAQAFGFATSDVGARNRAAIGQLQGVGQGYGAIQNRMMDARGLTGQAMLNALTGTSGQIISNAGAQYTGDALRAQTQNQMFQTGVNLAGMAAGGGMGFSSLAMPSFGGGGAQPQAAPASTSGGFVGAGPRPTPSAYYG